ncbi:MAG: MSCRAMM family protein [Desulfitobacteriaceae bacterium]
MTIIDRYLLTQSKKFILGPNEEARIDLKLKIRPLPSQTKITGQVSCEGSPVPNATVKILDSQFDPVAHVLTDDQGLYMFENLKPGDYKVTATAPGFLVANTYGFSLKAKVTIIINIKIKEDSSVRYKNTIYGKVSECITNKPVEEALLKLLSPRTPYIIAETISNDSGQYLFSGIPGGEYFVSASKPGFQTSDHIKFIAEKGQLIKINIQLHHSFPTSGTVSGIITIPFCQEPGDACVGLFRIEQDEETLIQIKTTNSEGLYLFSDVPAGEYVVKAKKEEKWESFKTYTII